MFWTSSSSGEDGELGATRQGWYCREREDQRWTTGLQEPKARVGNLRCRQRCPKIFKETGDERRVMLRCENVKDSLHIDCR